VLLSLYFVLLALYVGIVSYCLYMLVSIDGCCEYRLNYTLAKLLRMLLSFSQYDIIEVLLVINKLLLGVHNLNQGLCL
jgi:hypothetical protein